MKKQQLTSIARRLLTSEPHSTTILIRLMVGFVFLSEGIQKFIFPEVLGAARFEKIGLPQPDVLGYLVGSFEALCGLFVLIGLFTRLAVIPLLIIMIVAIGTTKITILQKDGFWEMLHASRTDWSMLLGCIFLLITGAGRWSLDKILLRH